MKQYYYYIVGILILLSILIEAEEKVTQGPNVIGGLPVSTNPYPYPFMVGILRTYSRTYFCSGSLISPNFVLTAAHCFVRTGEIFAMGTPTLTDPNQVETKALMVFNHPNFVRSSFENDIALIRLDTAVNISALPILLAANQSLEKTGTMATIMGWGSTTAYGYNPSAKLLETQVPLVSQEVCVATFPKERVFASMMCAGFAEGGKDTCEGDSGGPIIVNGVQVGVVSWGYGCGFANSYGVYTRTNHYSVWIKDTLAGKQQCVADALGGLKACQAKIRHCGVKNRMRWTGKSCRVKGVSLNDAGCQCYGYCNFRCKSTCISKLNRKFCKWDNGVCKTLAGNETGTLPRCYNNNNT